MANTRSISAQVSNAFQRGLGMALVISTLGTASLAHAGNPPDPLKDIPPAANWPFYNTSFANYKVRVIHDGLSGLELRLRMIARAQKKIDVMVYLFGTDNSGELMLHALMQKALLGVNVRVLVDFYNDNGKPDLSDEVAEAIRQNLAQRAGPGGLKGSFEIRYYNRGSMVSDAIKMNHRNHAKLIDVDDREVIVGGRNIGDDYFSMINEDVSYLDRDAYLWVPPVAPADNIGVQSGAIFDAYWNSDWVSTAKPWPAGKELSGDATWTAQPDDDDQAIENTLRLNVAKNSLRFMGAEPNELQGTKLMPTFNTSRVGLVIDRPHHDHVDRETTYVANSEIIKARRYLILENYTFASTTPHQNLLLSVANDFKTPVVLLTNGFETSDNGVLTRFQYGVEKKLLQASRNLWTLDMTGKWEPNQATMPNLDKPKLLATHSKTAVIYKDVSATTLIGSYNFDGRSENYNNENLLILEDNPWIAQETARGILNRTDIARQLMIGADGNLTYVDGTQIPQTKRTFVENLANFLGLSKFMRGFY